MCMSFDGMLLWLAGIGVGRLGCLSLRYFCCVCFDVECEKLSFNEFGRFQGAFGRVFI